MELPRNDFTFRRDYEAGDYCFVYTGDVPVVRMF
jgi:hypothetical protein